VAFASRAPPKGQSGAHTQDRLESPKAHVSGGCNAPVESAPYFIYNKKDVHSEVNPFSFIFPSVPCFAPIA
jgi:hypothetical protein